MNHASLFSGIGGFDLASEWMGWNNVLQCEIDPFCQKVLQHYWPNAELQKDIREIDGKEWQGKIDILTGGFPCQPVSSAGRRRGTADNRFLWPEMLRIIEEAQPTWIVAENVAGLVSMAQFDDTPPVDDNECAISDIGDVYSRTGPGLLYQILEEIETDGYEVQPLLVPACSVGAPHRRYRVWIVANRNDGQQNLSQEEIQARWDAIDNEDRHAADSKSAKRKGTSGSRRGRGRPTNDSGNDADTQGERGCEGQSEPHREQGRTFCVVPDWSEPTHEAATRLCGVDDGLPRELDGITISKWRSESLKAYGNAIVPEVAYQIFQSIPT